MQAKLRAEEANRAAMEAQRRESKVVVDNEPMKYSHGL